MHRILYILPINLLLVQLAFSQCAEPDANIWLNTWASCDSRANPIPENGVGHWIQYDFGVVRNLSKTWIWNTNDPTRLNQGFKLVKVDYSIDGEEWTNWGEMTFQKGEGDAVYGGFPGPDLVGIQARFVLLTAVTNHGHPTCSGLAEVKFNLLPEYNDAPLSGCGGAVIRGSGEVEEVSETEAFIYWEYFGDEPYFLFLYRAVGEEEWSEVETDEYEVFLEDLEPATEYEYVIAVECGDRPIYSQPGNFTTLPGDVTTGRRGHFVNPNQIRLFPSPTRGRFTLWYSATRVDELEYAIYDSRGRKLWNNVQTVSAGANEMLLDLGSYPDGVYFVETVEMGTGQRITEKVIKSGVE